MSAIYLTPHPKEDLEQYKVFSKKIQEINTNSSRELMDIAEKLIIKARRNKEIISLAMDLMKVSQKLTSIRLDEEKES